LCTITGVGPVVGTALVNTLERVPLKSADAFVAFTGHYRAKVLSSTATLVILARRIARTAWSIYIHKTEFEPGRLTKSLT